MSEAAQATSIPIDRGHCFWIKHTEPLNHAKRAAVCITAALATIAIVGGILLILSQQGYHIGGLNALSQAIEAKWLYIGVGVATAILAADTVLIATFIRSQQNLTYSSDQLNQWGILEKIQSENLDVKTACGHYWKITEASPLGEQERPVVYAALLKDSKGYISVIGFKTEKARHAYLDKGGYKDGELSFSQNLFYSAAEMKEIFNTDVGRCAHFGDGLREGFYRTETFTKNNRDAYTILAIKDKDPIFCKPQCMPKILEQYPGLISQKEIDELIEKKSNTEVVYLPENTFWVLEELVCEKMPLFALAYRKTGQFFHSTTYFLSMKERTDFIAEHFPEPAYDAGANFKMRERYTQEEVAAIITEREDIVIPTQNEAFRMKNIPAKIRGKSIYALSFQNEKIYFIEEKHRNAFIAKNLANHIDEDRVCDALFGKEKRKGILQLDSVDSLLTNDREYYLSTVNIDDKPVYAMLLRQEEILKYCFWLKREDRDTACSSGIFNSTQWVEIKQPEYSKEEASNLLEKADIQQIENRIASIENTEYWTQDFKISDGTTIYALAIGKDKARYFKTFRGREIATAELREKNFYSRNLLEQEIYGLIENNKNSNVNILTYKVDNTVVHICAYRETNEALVTIRTFKTEKECKVFYKQLTKTSFLAFHKPAESAKPLLDEFYLKSIENDKQMLRTLGSKHFITTKMPKKDKTGFLFSVFYNKDLQNRVEESYFTELEARNTFIGKQLSDCLDFTPFKNFIREFNLDVLLSDVGAYVRCKLHNGNQVMEYIIYRNEKNDLFGLPETEIHSLKFNLVDCTSRIETIDHDNFKQNIIKIYNDLSLDRLLTIDGQYFIQNLNIENIDMHIIFFKHNGRYKQRALSTDADLANYISKHGDLLKKEVKIELNKG
jgi:hypothetical protein